MPTAPREDSDNGWTLSLSFPDHIQQVKPIAAAAKLLQSCLTLYNPIDGNPPGSPVPGILQAKFLSPLSGRLMYVPGGLGLGPLQ